MIDLTLAVGDYDHVRDLADGEVRVEGCDLTTLVLPAEEIFQRFAARPEWDVSEFSFALYTSMRANGDQSLIAIPVFPSRLFRHGAIYVAEGGLEDPAELTGRRIGVPEWAQTAGIWARGMLADVHGVDLASVEWVQGGVQDVGREEKAQLHLPAGIEIRRETERPLEELLLADELDALICARPPHGASAPGAPIRTMIRDLPTAERGYFETSGIHPIMHLVVLRRELVERHPWLPRSLESAFATARARSVARLRDAAVSHLPLLWHTETVAELEKVGEERWLPYGIEANRQTLETFVRYAAEQGLSPEPLRLEQLFHDVDPVTASI